MKFNFTKQDHHISYNVHYEIFRYPLTVYILILLHHWHWSGALHIFCNCIDILAQTHPAHTNTHLRHGAHIRPVHTWAGPHSQQTLGRPHLTAIWFTPTR